MSDKPLLGSTIPTLLKARGIEVVFGIPGVHTVELYRGLPDSGLRHITPRHEQGAGFMADGYARATGKVAACFIITGPGLLNIATAMAQAMADSVPMLVITTLNPRPTLGRGEGRLHELRGQSIVAREIASLSLTVLTADQLVPALDEAFAVFASARPGPVVIEIPIDLLSEPFLPDARVAPRPSRPAPDPAAVTQAAALLNAARRPMVFAGGGAIAAAASFAGLVERLDAATLLTANAKGLLPGGHPLLAGGNLPSQAVRGLIRASDALLVIGSELGETDLEYYGEGPIEVSGPLIRVDIDPRQFGRGITPTLSITADADAFLRALLPLITQRAPTAAGAVAEVRARALAELEPRIARHRPLIEAIWRVLPEAILAGDSTEASYAAGLFAEPPAPRRFMSAATGFGTLGYALPAAIGAKAGCPQAPVVCLIGDGGLHYTVPELAAAAEAGLPVIVLLWNDQRYGEIEKFMIRRQMRTIGVELFATDFRQVTQGFGATHVTAATMAEVETELAAAAGRSTVTVIEMDAGRFGG